MSDTERQTIIGQTVENYTATKRNLAALLTKAAEYGKQLTTIAMYLKSTGGDGGLRQGNSLDTLSMPTPDEVRSLVEDTLETQKREKELHQRLVDLGVREYL